MTYDTETSKIHNLLSNAEFFIKSNVDCNLLYNPYVSMLAAKRIKMIATIRMYLGSNFFTMKEMMIYALHNCIYDEKFLRKLTDWDYKHIRDVAEIYCEDHLRNDMATLKRINCTVNLKKAEDYLTINSIGEVIALQLTKEKIITPNFVVKYKDRINYKYPPSIETERLIRVIKALSIIINTDKLK